MLKINICHRFLFMLDKLIKFYLLKYGKFKFLTKKLNNIFCNI